MLFFYGGINLFYVVKEVPTVKLPINAHFPQIIVMISQANSVQGGVGKMCDTRWSTSFFSHLFLNFWKKESLIIRPNVDPKVVSFDGIDKAYMWLCVKCAPFLFYFALLPDLSKWIWRQTTLTTHPYQRDAEKIPTNQKLKTGGKLSTWKILPHVKKRHWN